MSTRVRWIVLGVVLLLVLGLGALYWFNTNVTSQVADMGQKEVTKWTTLWRRWT